MKTTTLLTIALLVVGAIAVPAMADPDHADERKDAAKDKAAERDAKRDAAMEKREAHAEKHEERRNATIAKAQERCDAYENRTGRDLPACDRLKEVHDEPKSARRAAHALIRAIDALEHRIVVLEKLEVKFMEKLEGENLTANQTAAFEAKLVRIQEAQNKTLEKIEKMEQRLERLKAKWDAVRDHADDHKKLLVCHVGDDGNKTLRINAKAVPAHLRHNDTRGPCPDDVLDDDMDDGDEGSEASGDEASSDAASDDAEDAGDGSGSSDGSGDDSSDDPSAGDGSDPPA